MRSGMSAGMVHSSTAETKVYHFHAVPLKGLPREREQSLISTRYLGEVAADGEL